MRTLKYSILGLLMQAPTTGYDISKAFGSELGCFWGAKHSQIYPELDPPLDPTPKDVFRLRSYYSQWLPEDTYLELIQKQIEKRTVKLNYLSGCFEASYGNVDPLTLTGAARGDYLVLLSAVMRERTYMEWLEKSLDLVSAWADLKQKQS